MKTLTSLVGGLLTAGLATAQTSSPSGADDRSRSGSSTSSTASTPSHSSTQASPKPIAVEVVSADSIGYTITVASSSPSGRTTTTTGRTPQVTLPVEGKAASKLKAVKAGDQIVLKCREVAGLPGSEASRSGSMEGGSTTGSTSRPPRSPMSGSLQSLALQCNAVTDISKSRASASSPASNDGNR